MRRTIRFAPLLALGLALGFASGCREPTTRDGHSPGADGKTKRGVELQLPDPLPLPDHPKAASWIAQPSVAVAMVAPYSPVPIDLQAGLELALDSVTNPELAAELGRAIDLSATFANVILDDGQEVIRLSIREDARRTLAGRLAELEPVGEFGAVALPAAASPSDRPWLAWIDEADDHSLVLANSVEGLVTGRMLAAAYGKQPVFFTVDPNQLSIPIDVPFSRVTGRGDLSAMVIEAQAIDGQNPLAQLPIAVGTLGPLLDAGQISAGVSTRYSDHQSVVRDVIVEVNATVAELPFLIRGIGEGIAAKLATSLRTWDGRVLAAMGPQNHVRLAYGAADVEKSRVATLRLLQAVVDNVSLARNFSARIPKMALRRKVAKADGEDIELFVLHEAFSTAPELRPLVDGESRLNVAMAWSKRAGGGMIVVGPDAANELARWLEQTSATSAANPGSDQHDQQLLAASLAVDPAQLQPLLGAANGAEIGLDQLVGLAATGPKWQVTIEDAGAGKYVIDLRMPGPAKPKPKRAAR